MDTVKEEVRTEEVALEAETPEVQEENKEKKKIFGKKSDKQAEEIIKLQEQLAQEMGDFQWLAMMEQEDRFIREQEREDKLKEQEEISADADKTRVENEFNLFETEATLSTESLINSADKSNLISADSFIAFRDMVDDLLNDTKSNTTIIESMKLFASKTNEVDDQLSRYKNDVKQRVRITHSASRQQMRQTLKTTL